jgi:hypothetical protein
MNNNTGLIITTTLFSSSSYVAATTNDSAYGSAYGSAYCSAYGSAYCSAYGSASTTAAIKKLVIANKRKWIHGGHSLPEDIESTVEDDYGMDRDPDDDVSSGTSENEDADFRDDDTVKRSMCNTCRAQRVMTMCCTPTHRDQGDDQEEDDQGCSSSSTIAMQCLECDDVATCMDCTRVCHVQCMIQCSCSGSNDLQYVCTQCALACERCKKLHCDHIETSQPCVVCGVPLCLKCLFCTKCSFALKSCTACSKTYMNPPTTACVCKKCTSCIKSLVVQHVHKDAWSVLAAYL